MKQFIFFIFFIPICFIQTCTKAKAQNILNKTISIDVAHKRVKDVLKIISNKADFYFSYNSNIINKDSLVTLSVSNKTIQQVLGMIFKTGYEYKEVGNYIIIRRAPVKLMLITHEAVNDDKTYTLTGYIIDEETGDKIKEASIYEKERLLSTISNDDGFFRLKIKSKYKNISLTVSKEFYRDTTINIQPDYTRQINITMSQVDVFDNMVTISPQSLQVPDTIYAPSSLPDSTIGLHVYKKPDSSTVETTFFGKLLLTSKQKVQSINLSKFFTARPYQLSVVPGWSTNGKLNSQVVNHFSINMFGGYAAGVNGLELGGLFNIDKKDVKYVQAAGLFNTVGQSVSGVQLAGINNLVLDSLTGVQVAGITNYVRNNFYGLQMSGIYNHTGKNFNGVQATGIANYTKDTVKGLQLAGIVNINRNVQGAQIAGIVNYTKKLKGFQLALINIADTSEGLSLGLVNIIFKGYHKLALYSNEVTDFNIAFKTGNRKLYSILMGGMKLNNNKKAYSFGYGIGSDLSFSKKFGINPEISSQQLYMGDWDNLNLLSRLNVNLHYNISKHFSIFAGPAYNVYYSKQVTPKPGYAFILPSDSYSVHHFSDNVTGWLGWNAGITLF
ncbi:STN and carboxypeptidase regulatory-like domain-containing protein [Chitinophagaceae bacterium LWZ2-11]